MKSFPIAYAMKRKAKKMADGGDPEGSTLTKPSNNQSATNSAGIASASDIVKNIKDAIGMAEGGEVDTHLYDENGEGGHQSWDHDEDMIGRIMKARGGACYSEGGKVANQEHGENDNDLADFSPNEFDDLVLRDNLSDEDTGANSGDEFGNKREEEDRRDIVSRIMASQRKKDRNPRPA
jgi:hypothetical protein